MEKHTFEIMTGVFYDSHTFGECQSWQIEAASLTEALQEFTNTHEIGKMTASGKQNEIVRVQRVK